MASLYTSVLVSWLLQLFCLTHSADAARSAEFLQQIVGTFKEKSSGPSTWIQVGASNSRHRFLKFMHPGEDADGNQCASNPCQNGGTCQDQLKGYQCWCTESFEGWNCEIEKTIKIKCIFENGHCQQFCSEVAHSSRECSCTEGYGLAEDGVSCISIVQYPCGKAPLINDNARSGMAKERDHLSRIVDGENAKKGQSPWQIFLANKGKFLCGAVLLSPQWVITAAHCIYDKRREDLQAVAGEHVLNEEEGTEQKRNVSEIIQHENYNPKTVDNDIAMLKLDVPIVLNDYAVPICLPEPSFAVRELRQILLSTVSGWGKQLENGLIANTLQILQVPIVWTSVCRQTTNYNITENMFCAGYIEAQKDTCKGDSGGPHVTKYKDTWFLTGIVSWGEGCAREGKYGIYTKVHKYFNWIRQFLDSPSPTVSADSSVNLTESVQPVANLSHV